jgi:hypothetical protein
VTIDVLLQLRAWVGLTIVMALLFPAPAGAYHGKLLGYHWGDPDPMPVDVWYEDNTDGTWSVPQAVADWSGTPVIEFRAAPPDGCNGSFGRVELCTVSLGPEGVPGGLKPGSYVWCSGFPQHLCAVIVELNRDRSLTSDQKRHVTCHELGHVIGLAHREQDPTAPSCMIIADLPNPPFPPSPDDHDHSAVCIETYDHADNGGPIICPICSPRCQGPELLLAPTETALRTRPAAPHHLTGDAHEHG